MPDQRRRSDSAMCSNDCSDVQATRKLVVHAGDESYPIGDGIEAVTLADALAALRQAAVD